jgi:hypothetical protein
VAPDTADAEEDDHRGRLSEHQRSVVRFRCAPDVGNPRKPATTVLTMHAGRGLLIPENRRVVGAHSVPTGTILNVAGVLDTGLDHTGVAVAKNRGRAEPPSPRRP